MGRERELACIRLWPSAGPRCGDREQPRAYQPAALCILFFSSPFALLSVLRRPSPFLYFVFFHATPRVPPYGGSNVTTLTFPLTTGGDDSFFVHGSGTRRRRHVRRPFRVCVHASNGSHYPIKVGLLSTVVPNPPSVAHGSIPRRSIQCVTRVLYVCVACFVRCHSCFLLARKASFFCAAFSWHPCNAPCSSHVLSPRHYLSFREAEKLNERCSHNTAELRVIEYFCARAALSFWWLYRTRCVVLVIFHGRDASSLSNRFSQ